MRKTKGIHHISAIVGDPQENIDFYAKLLGLRLVKQTVNFDDPGSYHFYFGDQVGSPGTIITFFPWQGARRGRVGGGQVGWTTFVVPEGALAFWKQRLTASGISFAEETRFTETYLRFCDPHGLQLELVERKRGPKSKWSTDEISTDLAIKGFGGALLFSRNPQKTQGVLTDLLGFHLVGKDGTIARFQAEGELGQFIDLEMTEVPIGLQGAGTVHHIAWRAADEIDQQEWREAVIDYGYIPTDVQDRNYFRSIYFRELGGILFEIATDVPGFEIDESYEELGQELKLPHWYEPYRSQIQMVLPKIVVPYGKRGDSK